MIEIVEKKMPDIRELFKAAPIDLMLSRDLSEADRLKYIEAIAKMEGARVHPLAFHPERVAILDGESNRMSQHLLGLLAKHQMDGDPLLVVDSLSGIHVDHLTQGDVVRVAKEMAARNLTVKYTPEDSMADTWGEMAKRPKGKSKYTRKRRPRR